MQPVFGPCLDGRIQAGELDIPLLPEAARKVLDACERDDFDMGGLAGIVRRDPALAAQFLRLANSPLFGSRSPIVSLPQALARLGTSQTRQIAMLVTCKVGVFSCAARQAAARQLRSHAVATALWAQEIARLRRMNVEESFLCGLLGDVAMPSLWQLAAELEKIHHVTWLESDVDAHIHSLHNVVGADIALRWGLPARVASAIRLHHAAPEELAAASVGATLEGVVATVQLAATLADGSLNGKPFDVASIQPHRSVAALSLYGAELEKLLAREEVVVEAMRSVA